MMVQCIPFTIHVVMNQTVSGATWGFYSLFCCCQISSEETLDWCSELINLRNELLF